MMGFLFPPFFKNPIFAVALESALSKGDCYIGRGALYSYRYWAHELRKFNFGSFDKEEPQVSKSYLIGQGRARCLETLNHVSSIDAKIL